MKKSWMYAHFIDSLTKNGLDTIRAEYPVRVAALSGRHLFEFLVQSSSCHSRNHQVKKSKQNVKDGYGTPSSPTCVALTRSRTPQSSKMRHKIGNGSWKRMTSRHAANEGFHQTNDHSLFKPYRTQYTTGFPTRSRR